MDSHNRQKILVTGGTGLVGSYLLRYLIQHGHTSIRAIKRPGSKMDLVADIQNHVEWIDTDILDIYGLESALDGIHQVYHCAAVISFAPRDTPEMMEVNVAGTANVVNLCMHAGVEKLLFVSSVAAIGRSKPSQTLDETNRWERSPYNTQYGLSKYKAEQEVWRGIAEGLNAVIINPSIILGSSYWHRGPARFFSMLHKGFPFYPRGGSGFVDVRDVIRMMVRLMESDIQNERFIANTATLSYYDFFRQIATHLNVKPPAIKITPLIQHIAWRWAWLQSRLTGKHPFITKETASQSARTYHYKNNKSLERLGFEYTPLDTTIRQTALQFLESIDQDLQPAFLEF